MPYHQLVWFGCMPHDTQYGFFRDETATSQSLRLKTSSFLFNFSLLVMRNVMVAVLAVHSVEE